jgi:predicted RNA binding protein YcfA (HicA-like mRNA interferase family)
MSAHVTIDQTDTGWRVEVTEGDHVIVETDGPSCIVAVHPDDDDTQTPLAVTLS